MELKRRVISYSNKYIEACIAVSLAEDRLIDLFVSQINNDPEDKEVLSPDAFYTLNIKMYAKLYDLTYKEAASQVRTAVKRLDDLRLKIELEKDKVTSLSIITGVYTDYKNKIVAIRWSKDIIPYISQLEGNFTQFLDSDLAALRTINARLLCKYLKMSFNKYGKYKKDGEKNMYVPIPIEALRFAMNIQKKYSYPSAFKTKCIDRALEEIYDKLGIKIRANTIKTTFPGVINFTLLEGSFSNAPLPRFFKDGLDVIKVREGAEKIFIDLEKEPWESSNLDSEV